MFLVSLFSIEVELHVVPREFIFYILLMTNDKAP